MSFPSVRFETTTAFSLLSQHYQWIKDKHMRDFFNEDEARTNRFSLLWNELYFDFSRNRITEETMRLLFKLAEECKLDQAISSMFDGEPLNQTENRAVLHTALRAPENQSIIVNGMDIIPGIHSVLKRMEHFCAQVHSGEWKGFSGKTINTIVNIGIGGSDLGPVMVTEALKSYQTKGVKVKFVSNVDGTHISETLKELNPETTIFLIASKTFTTQETMANARTARAWFLHTAINESFVASHFVAISTNLEAVSNFGINPDNMFEFWDWVGGRYSLWSSIGLSIALAIGFENFRLLLDGAHAMDKHFKNTAFSENIPVISALLGIWYVNFFGAATHAVLPYDQYLHRFAAYLQQGDMESNGKSVNRLGHSIKYNTGPVIWGEPGTNGQHAFYQLIHQGTQLIPCDFIAPAISHNPLGNHHNLLLSNFIAQSAALMHGKSIDEVTSELSARGMSVEQQNFQAPFRVFEGNKPSNTYLMKEINPFNLGALIAMYEHRIFVQGIIWNVFSFDQWGVELGKQLANGILPDLENETISEKHDGSTKMLLKNVFSMRS